VTVMLSYVSPNLPADEECIYLEGGPVSFRRTMVNSMIETCSH